jgi:hypothetical protein
MMNKKMTAYMIMDFNNPVSVEYSKKSIESFKCVSDLIEIIPYQCTTPKDLVWRDNEKDQHGFGPLLDPSVCGVKLSFVPSNPKKGGSFTQPEIAGLVSHYKLWRKQATAKERFIILEHDAYILNEEKFRALFEALKFLPDAPIARRYGHCFAYWNIGIAVECYSLHPQLAEYILWRTTRKDNPFNTIHGGPMAMLFNHTIWWRSIYPQDGMDRKLTSGGSAPVTQLYSKELGITMDHGYYSNIHYENMPNLEIIP